MKRRSIDIVPGDFIHMMGDAYVYSTLVRPLQEHLQKQPKPFPASMKNIDHVDLLREQVKILSREIELHSSILKRLSDEAANSPIKEQIQIEMQKVKDEIRMKNQQIASLEKQMTDSISVSQSTIDKLGLSLSYNELLEQLNEKSFEPEDIDYQQREDEHFQRTLVQVFYKINRRNRILSVFEFKPFFRTRMRSILVLHLVQPWNLLGIR